jgi:hypothetical protein
MSSRNTVAEHHDELYEPCTGCFKPETTSGVVIAGDLGWTAAVIEEWVPEIEAEVAWAMASIRFDEDGLRPDDRAQTTLRLCPECAKRTKSPVYRIADLRPGDEAPFGIDQDRADWLVSQQERDRRRESRLRGRANRRGWKLMKSRIRDATADDFGRYKLVDAYGYLVVGDRFSATLDEVERELVGSSTRGHRS